jgi:hypothetical protein
VCNDPLALFIVAREIGNRNEWFWAGLTELEIQL